MRKLGLTLLLSCIIFLFSFVPVFATESESADLLSTTDSIFPLEVGDVLPSGTYVFNQLIVLDSDYLSLFNPPNGREIVVPFVSDAIAFRSIYFYAQSDSAFQFSYRPDAGSVYVNSSWKSQSYRYIRILEDVIIDEYNIGLFNNLSPYDNIPGSVDFFDTMDIIFDGFLSLFDSIVLAFWIPNEGLTFIGVLAVISLGIAISFLIFAVIRRFLKFRG